MRLRQKRPTPILPAAAAGAKWWADHLRAGYNRFNVDGNSPNSGFIALIGALAHSHRGTSPSEAQIAAFELCLAAAMSKDLLRQRKMYEKRNLGYVPRVTTGVDYSPETLLRQALIETGLFDHSMVMPTKSHMSVTPTEVWVIPGSGTNRVDLPIAEPSAQTVSA